VLENRCRSLVGVRGEGVVVATAFALCRFESLRARGNPSLDCSRGNGSCTAEVDWESGDGEGPLRWAPWRGLNRLGCESVSVMAYRDVLLVVIRTSLGREVVPGNGGALDALTKSPTSYLPSWCHRIPQGSLASRKSTLSWCSTVVVPKFVTERERGTIEVDELDVDVVPNASLERGRPFGRLGVKL
jgi:hypothetical protein